VSLVHRNIPEVNGKIINAIATGGNNTSHDWQQRGDDSPTGTTTTPESHNKQPN